MLEHLSLLILSWKIHLSTHLLVYFYSTKSSFLPLAVSKLSFLNEVWVYFLQDLCIPLLKSLI